MTASWAGKGILLVFGAVLAVLLCEIGFRILRFEPLQVLMFSSGMHRPEENHGRQGPARRHSGKGL